MLVLSRHCSEQKSGAEIYQATPLCSPKKPPVGPLAGRMAKATGAFAPCSVVRKPLCPFRSVATYPGLTELILIDVFRSSFAKKTVRALRAVLEALYARVGGILAAKEVGSLLILREPISLERLTIRPASERRSRGSMALVTAKTPKTLVANVLCKSSNVSSLGGVLPSLVEMPALFTRMSSFP
jgi:hypothetical protein